MSTNKQRVFLYVMILLTLLNLGSLIAVLVIVTKNDLKLSPVKPELVERRGRFMQNEIGFDEEQLQTFNQSRMMHREEILPLRNELHRLNGKLISEATSTNPDTSMCLELTQQIGDVHTEIKQVTYKHIIEVSNMATPDQIQQLKHLYLDMFQVDQPGKRHGKGKQHRWRGAKNQVEN